MTDKSDYAFNDEEMTVTLHLANTDVECSIVTILTDNEQDYIVLLPLEENELSEEGEVWFYRYFENEDITKEPTLESIATDEEFEKISAIFEDFLEHSEYDELITDEEY